MRVGKSDVDYILCVDYDNGRASISFTTKSFCLWRPDIESKSWPAFEWRFAVWPIVTRHCKVPGL